MLFRHLSIRLRNGLKSLQKGGRPPILQPELVDTIAREWTQAGTGRGGDWRGYTSMEEVVEHPLKPFNDRWYKAFTLDRKCTTARAAMALASDILCTTTADSIDRDMRTLPDTMRSIIKNKGDWADDELC